MAEKAYPNVQSSESILRTFDAQQVAAQKLRNSTTSDRLARLKRIESALKDWEPRILEALALDLGKSREEALVTEIFPLTSELKNLRRHLRGWVEAKPISAPLTFPGSNSYLRWEPLGRVLIISPWNFPFQLSLGPAISALAAGNTVVLKPSELSPNTSKLLLQLITAIFPPEEFAVIEGGRETAQELLRLPFNLVFFTGSTRVGREVMKAASNNLSKVVLELGGKSPLILMPDCDLAHAAARIAWGKGLNSGQTCVAPDYVLVPEQMSDDLLPELRKAYESLYGRPETWATNPDYGRIINQRHFERLATLLDQAEAHGAKIVFGGERDPHTRFFSPTVLQDVALDNPLMGEEIFGPLLPVLTFRHLDEAIAVVDALPPPLVVYVFSRSTFGPREVVKRTRSGAVLINDVVSYFANHRLPFGGIGQSGMGQSHGRAGFEAMSHARPVMQQPRWSPLFRIRPPYTQRLHRLIKLMVRYF